MDEQNKSYFLNTNGNIDSQYVENPNMRYVSRAERGST